MNLNSEQNNYNINNKKRKRQFIIEWIRDQTKQSSSQGYSQRDIASKLHVSLGTVNKDITFLREQAKENIQKYIDEKIPEEYEKCLTGINSILKESWDIAQQAKDSREKM